MSNDLLVWRGKVASFVSDAHRIIGDYDHPTSSRVYTVDALNKSLRGLSLKQVDLMRQSLRCIEHGIFRAAHVMCWAATADFLQELCAADGFVRILAVRSKWTLTDIESLRETCTEYALIEAMKAADIITKSDMKGLHGLLNRRNECAHPSDVFPDFNQSLGYVGENIARMKSVQKKNKSFFSSGSSK
ncbi:MAG: hypothetical protein AAGH90_05355 [Pseudomonadota bacterium]